MAAVKGIKAILNTGAVLINRPGNPLPSTKRLSGMKILFLEYTSIGVFIRFQRLGAGAAVICISPRAGRRKHGGI